MTAALKKIAKTAEQPQWASEAIRRRDDIRSGRVKPVPAAKVYRRIERLLGTR